VEEHLQFYGGLKGTMLQDDIDDEVRSMIVDLGLPHKRNELSRNLSGGMQRKLSIAISFLAKSRFVYTLDTLAMAIFLLSSSYTILLNEVRYSISDIFQYLQIFCF
jgi:ABC-type Na+ transport system ATPase subunit NatA